MAMAPGDLCQNPFPAMEIQWDMHPRKIKASTGRANQGLIKELEDDRRKKRTKRERKWRKKRTW